MPTTSYTISRRTGETYDGVSDAHGFSFDAGTNYGGDGTLRNSTFGERSFLKFDDLSSADFNGLTISNAVIRFTISEAGASYTIGCHELLADWLEMQVTWNNRTTANAWNTAGTGAGTDRIDPARFTFTEANASGSVILISGSAVDDWVQDCIDGNNYGLILRATAGNINLNSSEATNEAERPELTFEVTTGGSGAELAGTAADVASATGALTTSIKLTAAAVSTAAATGALSTQVKLTGAALDVASATGALSTQIKFGGAAADIASATGALTTNIKLAGSAANVANATGALSAQIKLAGNALSQALATAGFDTGVLLSGNAQDIATAVGALTTQIRISGVAQDTVIATASLTTQIKFTGNAQAIAAAAGSLVGSATLLSGNAADIVTATAALSTAALLSGNAQDVVTLTANLTIEKPLTVAMVSEAVATGQLSTEVRLNAFAVSSVTASGNLGNVQLVVLGARKNGARMLLGSRPRNIQTNRRR